ncbi:hypothetical protein BJ875DRAFT_215169 [Amylocarpus encephaloides]|uniref:N-acetyltransferase domain-containing protein n=1 Tax=Amylocarpus encephaloides TaxID=45428 RepID=A0A9P7YNS3_9HELO|nr:hypothetical protein BJ875DRAFT_215169 [Amylocarpus encephaloides]
MSSSRVRQSACSEDEDEMDVDSGSARPPSHSRPSADGSRNGSLAVVSRDTTDWLQHVRSLQETDVIILLTPVVIPISPDPADISDPFEPLGLALAKRHARIRQVPYTKRNGITSTHLGFIKRGHVIILCVAFRPEENIPLDLAEITFAVSDNKPCIIVVCCTPIDDNQAIPFPTVIQIAGYSPPALESTAALIFGEGVSSREGRALNSVVVDDPNAPRLWPVEQWNEVRDIASVTEMWNQDFNGQFSLDQGTFASLLRRPGYAKHYVVRDMKTGVVLGFCATYLAYVDKEGEKLIASLAVLLVRSTHRHLGIGLSLYSHAVSQLKRTRGVIRLQFGSTFPRILYGPPVGAQFNEEWFRRRGWRFERLIPGEGQIIYDMILNTKNWSWAEPGPAKPLFRLCTQEDMKKVIEMIEVTAARQGKMGWFDQYMSLMNGPNVKDIVIGVGNDNVLAAALTYTPSCGSPIPSNLPWAAKIGPDVGGITCICLVPTQNKATLGGLLNACVKTLSNQGVRRVFLDGIAGDGEIVGSLQALGFEEWAQYRDLWKDT